MAHSGGLSGYFRLYVMSNLSCISSCVCEWSILKDWQAKMPVCLTARLLEIVPEDRHSSMPRRSCPFFVL